MKDGSTWNKMDNSAVSFIEKQYILTIIGYNIIAENKFTATWEIFSEIRNYSGVANCPQLFLYLI